VRLVLSGQVPDKLAELADGLCLVTALEALLEFGHVEAALRMARAKALRDLLAIRVRGAEIGVATRNSSKVVLVGHVSLPSMELI
jgi:hypothetical protein